MKDRFFGFRLIWVLSVAVLLLFPFGGCEDSAGGSGSSAGGRYDDDDAADMDDDTWAGDDTADDDAGSADDDGAADDDTPVPPEEDMEPGTYPQVCQGAVYVLASDYDFVSRIDAETLEIKTITVGREPKILTATPDCSQLLTLNAKDDSVSIISLPGNEVQTLDIRPGLNSLAVSPSGNYALAYYSFTDDGQDYQGYGEISIVDLRDRTVRSLAVGFPPDSVLYTNDERALLVSTTILGLVRLTDGHFETLPTGLDIDAGQRIRKAAVSADSSYAFILAEAATDLLSIDLSSLEIEELELGCYPTDMDVAAEGDITLLLCRGTGQILVLDNGDLSLDAYETDEVVGSGELTADGRQAVLFTNSESIERVHLFSPADGKLTTYYTVKPLVGAAIAPDDRTAVLFHEGGDGQPLDDFDQYFDGQEAISIFNLKNGLINPVETAVRATTVSFGSDGHYAVVPQPNRQKLLLLDLQRGLVDVLATPSLPLDAGLIDDLALVYVLQDHPLGRISFFDTQTLAVRTVTGFLLNGQIGE
ncbi:MAG: hypothetical protein GX444_18510 [Myxococcales bacterium]|nr:hypothetical protein [Myxococcales bacterium]